MSDHQRERFRLLHCGFIFRATTLYPALTARQQLEIVLRWGEGVSARATRKGADVNLALLGLSRRSSYFIIGAARTSVD
jgi:putative ABC transport system ATP-binding protein